MASDLYCSTGDDPPGRLYVSGIPADMFLLIWRNLALMMIKTAGALLRRTPTRRSTMPYIAPKARTGFDPLIDALAERIIAEAKAEGTEAAFAGLLNYACTRLALQIVRLQFGKTRYWLIAVVTGTFQNIAQEFYRRVGVPYEEKQIVKNGDVDLYKIFSEENQKS